MRRCGLPVLLLLAACGGGGPPQVGLVVSGAAAEAAALAAAGDPVVHVAARAIADPFAADTALFLAEAFAGDRSVIAVIGHANSAASLAASQIYNRSGLVQIAPTTTATAYSRAGPYSFRMVPGDDQQARFLARALHSSWPAARRIAVIYVNDDYGRSFYRELGPLLDSAALDVVFDGLYTEAGDPAHLRELGERMAAAQPDVLVWLGRPGALATLLSATQQPHLHVLCGDACDSPSLYANEGGQFTGVRFVRFVDPDRSTPALDAFRSRFTAATDGVLTAEVLLTYDGMLAVQAALHSGARTRGQVRQFLHSLGRERAPLEGLAGPIAFDENGDLMRPYLLAEVGAQAVRPVALEP